jgi:hypothetical protein
MSREKAPADWKRTNIALSPDHYERIAFIMRKRNKATQAEAVRLAIEIESDRLGYQPSANDGEGEENQP